MAVNPRIFPGLANRRDTSDIRIRLTRLHALRILLIGLVTARYFVDRDSPLCIAEQARGNSVQFTSKPGRANVY